MSTARSLVAGVIGFVAYCVLVRRLIEAWCDWKTARALGRITSLGAVVAT